MQIEDIIKEYQEELGMSVDIREFPHSFNILRKWCVKTGRGE